MFLFKKTLLAISKFALLASKRNEQRNIDDIKSRLHFIEKEEIFVNKDSIFYQM